MEKQMNESNQPILLEMSAKKRRSKPPFNPKEYKIQALRECPTPAEMQLCDTPDKAADYWLNHVVTHPYFTRAGNHLASNRILATRFPPIGRAARW
jgi:hypothetical protein